ncbi:hypothetical protein HOLleu_43531 [Holothuria leucospilota]|uniref:Uncharacterized protein n=1 Tax=Holothuria leucospilota TaxID=206669 RepID=A0A9Q0YGV6_HOLLE|nr:hypothetical protein HOLleu_43531 [Holothuria leucospilota]
MAPNTSKIPHLFAQEECLILLASMYVITKKRQKKFRKHRWWVHRLLRNRRRYGAYYTLVNELRFDDEKFKQYFRLTRNQFAQVLELVEKDLVKHCRSREVICPRQRLAICIRYVHKKKKRQNLYLRLNALTI